MREPAGAVLAQDKQHEVSQKAAEELQAQLAAEEEGWFKISKQSMGQPLPVPLSSAATPSLCKPVSKDALLHFKGALLHLKDRACLPKKLLPAVLLHVASPFFQNWKLGGP